MKKNKKSKRPTKKNKRGKAKRKGAARSSTAKRGGTRQFLGHHIGYEFKDYMAARAFALRAHRHMKKTAKIPVIKKVEAEKANYTHVVQVPIKDVDSKKLSAIAKEAVGKKKSKAK